MLAIIATALFLLASNVQGGSLSPQLSITSGGNTRTFYYYAPDNYNPAQGAILYLHGGGGSGLGSSAKGTDNLWRNLADRVGVLTLFPEGKPQDANASKHNWNDCMDGVPQPNRAGYTDWDDVQFIRDLVAWIGTSYDGNVNMKRIYAAGESKGAMMSMRLALEANDIIAAVASLAGNVPVANDNSGAYKCRGYDAPYTPGTSEAVPILLFKGDADVRIPFGYTSGSDHNIYALQSDPCHRPANNAICPPNGGTCHNGCVHSFFDSLAFWEWKHNLSYDPTRRVPGTETIQYADTIPNCNDDCTACDGSTVIRHNIGPAPYRVVVDRAIGAGHHFPGPVADDANCDILSKSGWKNRDALSSPDGQPYVAEEIWAFFDQFTLDD